MALTHDCTRRLDELRRRVQHEIQSAGAFVVHTRAGLFIARKA
jgi:hypothetical protein